MNLSQKKSMLPVGTEVYFKNMYGVVKFTSNSYMTVCIKTFPHERVRDVCLLVYETDLDQIELVNGNHSHES